MRRGRTRWYATRPLSRARSARDAPSRRAQFLCALLYAGAVVACKSARALASEMLKLVNALTSKAVRFYWPLKSDSDRLRKLLQLIISRRRLPVA